MNILDQFIVFLLALVGKIIYIWGGQGEIVSSEKQIRRMETSKVNADRVIAFWRKMGNVIGFDCSGALIQALISLGLFTGDTTANGLMHKCTMISRSEVKRGDWAFRVYKSGEKAGQAYHIGVITDNNFNIFEVMGRDDGAVIRGVDQHDIKGYWTHFGRPSYFKDLIEAPAVIEPVLPAASIACPYSEPVKCYTNGIKFYGNDARWFEWYLLRAGYDCGCTKNLDKYGTDGAAGEMVWKAINAVQSKTGVGSGNAGSLTRAQIKKM